ncbi:hypothetical protein EVAR_34029_1 [Eumeta japonica]|uniref:Uncharacterized protein n=1 Tax=Eumeta variegata TaxID=151549 RepID=A0A4C1VR37_EUMVA|nr:hypothetical protein EVAR_34029_1 [Eumeta japonica]
MLRSIRELTRSWIGRGGCARVHEGETGQWALTPARRPTACSRKCRVCAAAKKSEPAARCAAIGPPEGATRMEPAHCDSAIAPASPLRALFTKPYACTTV